VLEPVRTISNVVIEIAFPVFARLRGQAHELVEQLVSFTRQNLVLALPYLAVVFLAADDILLVFFGPQWVAAAPAARLLCFVGVLRAVSLVMPPLLDGIGRPSATLLYMAVSAVVLPVSYVIFAIWLGPSIDYVSVAYAWVVAYPLAFVVLMVLTLAHIEVTAVGFLRRIAGVPICVIAGALAGFAVRPFLHDLSAGLRLSILSAVTVVVVLVLLAYFQGISVRTIARSLKKP
jgi:O-antigen/teichoic acid export membrane protein